MNAQDRLVEAIARVPRSVRATQDALRHINDGPLLEPVLDVVMHLAMIHGENPDTGLANEFATVRATLAQFTIDPVQHEEAEERWFALRGAMGNLYADIDRVLSVAKEIGISPTDSTEFLPEARLIERGVNDRNLAALKQRLEAFEQMIVREVAPAGQLQGENNRAQTALVERYVDKMRGYIESFRAGLTAGDTVNLSGLERAAYSMGSLTRSFRLTVGSVASRATAVLRAAVDAMLAPLARLTRGLLTLVNAVIRQEQKAPSGTERQKVEERAVAMILEGNQPPAADWPKIQTLDFNRSSKPLKSLEPMRELRWLNALYFKAKDVRDFSPLENLVGLVSLTAAEVSTSDLSGLAQLRKLERLRLSGPEIRDLAPLAPLAMLRELDLSGTAVSDLTPLATLSALETLYLTGTRIGRIDLLARLGALETLGLDDTAVSDIGPLRALRHLGSLNLRKTQVEDLAPLSRLTEIQTLDLSDTPVLDLGPLATLSSLRAIRIARTRIIDLEPLTGIETLREIVVESDARRDELARSSRLGRIISVEEFKEAAPQNLLKSR